MTNKFKDTINTGTISVSCKCVRALAFIILAGAVSSASLAQDGTPLERASSFEELNRFDSTLKVIQASEINDSRVISSLNQASFQSIDEIHAPQQAANDERIESIHDRINLLKKLIREKKAAEAAEKEFAEKSPKTAPVIETPAAPPKNKTVRTTNVPPVDVESGLNENAVTEEPKIHLPPANSGQVSGSAVLTEPVNSFEMANSLFYTGNISAARKSYEAKLREKVSPNDEAWLKCLVACCYRLEGNYAKAEETFRDVSNLKQSSYPVDYAKWNLQYVAQRRVAQEKFQSIDKDIDTILNKLKKND